MTREDLTRVLHQEAQQPEFNWPKANRPITPGDTVAAEVHHDIGKDQESRIRCCASGREQHTELLEELRR